MMGSRLEPLGDSWSRVTAEIGDLFRPPFGMVFVTMVMNFFLFFNMDFVR